MPARTLHQLQMDGETPETLQSALDALDKIVPPSDVWRDKLEENREELLTELCTIKGRLI